MRRRIFASAQSVLGDKQGASAVEFAIVIPLALAFIYLIMDFGYFFYNSTMVDSAAYFLSRDIINQPAAGRTLPWARLQFASELTAASFSQVDPGFILSVRSLSDVDPTQPAPTTDAFDVTNQVPTVVRIIYPRSSLVNVIPISGVWSTLFNNPIDISIVVVPR